ncbi:MAG TPA: TlpA disulfide reductase family protein [Vicinamibacterales bacterium]|nr:TlpA disulfide reductase family protein [Vicinamibacterales bacterium]
MTVHIVVSMLLGLLVGQAAAPQSPAPKTTGATPSACLMEVRDYVAKRNATLTPIDTSILSNEQIRALIQSQAWKDRVAVNSEISRHRVAMLKECLARFDATAVADGDVTAMIDLHTEAGSAPDLVAPLVTRALSLKTLPETQTAVILVSAVRTGLREPKGDARNARLEAYVDRLDTLSNAVIESKIGAHSSMNGYYRADDIDAGIIKHSTWLIETGKKLPPDLRKKFSSTILSAYENMAEAWAGQGMTAQAIDLLKRAPTDWPEVPTAATRLKPTLDRYLLVDGAAPAIVGTTWLNAPAGTTQVDMKGHVTLLEFTAWWCGPCKESYPGINRLRERFGRDGFRVLLATQLYGYFEKEGLPDRSLPAEREVALDKTYFASHELPVPIVIGPRTSDVRDPNDLAYRVGGIPQIQIIDKQGRIRLIMVGYDDANEPKLAKFIAGLLAEK